MLVFSRTFAAGLALLIAISGSAFAGIITFNDLTDMVNVTDTTGRITGGCTGESCNLVLTGPPGTASLFFTSMPFWTEPDSTIVSDQFCQPNGCFVTQNTFNILFTSDTDGTQLGDCRIVGACGVENGQVQTAITIMWKDANNATILTDTIGFQSDVPEPASWLLVAGGVAHGRRFTSIATQRS
jgi:hypothetical protein